MKRSALYDIGGWVGVAAILGSYFLLSLGIIDGQSLIYHGMLLVGSALIAVISIRHRAYQPAVLNIVFFCLAIVAIVRIQLL